jgi:hypothetical protein
VRQLGLASLGVAPCASLARVSGYRRDMLAFAGATVDSSVKQANKRRPIIVPSSLDGQLFLVLLLP